jgi:hypothetical protein
MPLARHTYLKLRIIVDKPRSTDGQRSTAHLIEPQTFFSLVSGEKADNKERNTLFLTLSQKSVLCHIKIKISPWLITK